jgi:ATP-dependent helicase/nuclease subunit A
VRKRKPLADRMVKALKEHGIAVAGADRMRLTQQLAVMDLMVLGDFLLLPEDDLALATLLKTPFFGFDDDDLFAIGYEREGSLWKALHARVTLKPAYGLALARLEGWRDAARRQSPFAFYAARLEEDGLRAALLARLGPDAADAITEFLSLALAYEQSEPPTLQGFLHWLRICDPEIKRDLEQERDEVRVMTVHGSKGLEAPIVFLADTCAFKAADNAIVPVALKNAPPEAPKLAVWALKAARRIEAVEAACEAIKTAEREEYHRLLYVGMTRARDRLYVGGFENGLGRAKGCWWDLIDAGLGSRLTEGKDALGMPVRRMECPQAVPCEAAPRTHAPRWDGAFPDWLRQAAREELAAGIINPSKLVASAPKSDAPADPKASSPDAPAAAVPAASPEAPSERSKASRGYALMRGTLAHRLLEALAPLPRKDWTRVGTRVLTAEGDALSEKARKRLLDGVTAILGEPDFAELFGPDGRTEVAIAAEITGPDGTSQRLSGQIDRLIVRESDVLIVDFKTGAHLPASAEEAPAAYIAQLAAYRVTLRRLFPGKTIRAGLLWIDGPVMMELPQALLDAAVSSLAPG